MNRRYIILRAALTTLALSLFAGCRSTSPQELNPAREEKYVEITIVNDDYARTNDALYKLTDAAGGEITGGSAGFDEFGGRAEYTIDVPYMNYDTFVESVSREFGPEAVERAAKTGVSAASEYAAVSREIERKSEALEDVKTFASFSSSDPAAIEFERKRLEKDIARLRTKRIETLARMDLGRVVVKWSSPGAGFPPGDYPFPGAPIPGLPARELNYDEPGKTLEFGLGEDVEINLNMPDADKVNLTATVDYNTEKVSLKANAAGSHDTVELKHMCQSVIVSGDVIPEVRLTGELASEQIVITPLMSDACQRVGYEIRAGTLERGCNKGESKRIFNRLMICRGVKPKAVPERKAKARATKKAKAAARVKPAPKPGNSSRGEAKPEKGKQTLKRKRASSREVGPKSNAKLKREIIDYIKQLP